MRITSSNGLTITPSKESVTLTACRKNCSEDCVDYKTPVEICYNPLVLFPGDPQWGPYDIKDTLRNQTLTRTFYLSQNGSCIGEAESAEIPLHTKVGPLGDPRSCGVFKAD
jgi:hypothetical protein